MKSILTSTKECWVALLIYTTFHYQL